MLVLSSILGQKFDEKVDSKRRLFVPRGEYMAAFILNVKIRSLSLFNLSLPNWNLL
jgi:hypothetical protein